MTAGDRLIVIHEDRVAIVKAYPARTVRRASIRALLLVVCPLLLCSCSQPTPPNILLIVVDTLRADRLGCYGNQDGLTPFLDSLAARGFVFQNAYAQSPWTNPSIASLFTSRYQSQHGVVSFGSVLSDTEVTLAEQLQAAGFATAAFSANGLIAARYGFAQGYDEYQAILVKGADGPRQLWQARRADEINKRALAWLDGRANTAANPVFLYMQYMEMHTPYQPEETALDRVFKGREWPDLEKVSSIAVFGSLVGSGAQDLRDVEDVYDASLISLDAELKALFGELERRGFLENAFVIVTADHGEEFLDHGLIGHGHNLCNAVVRVPLIVLPPGQSRHVDVTEVVSLIDLAPTLLDWLGKSPPTRFEGRSFKPTLVPKSPGWLSVLGFLKNGADRPSVAYSELVKDEERDQRRLSPHLRAVIDGPAKVITGLGGEREFYDLAVDPGETGNATLPEPERASLERLLADFEARCVTGAPPAPSVDAETQERMRALGYHD